MRFRFSPVLLLVVPLFLATSSAVVSAQSVPGVDVVSSRPGELILRLGALQPTIGPDREVENQTQSWFFRADTGYLPQLRGTVALPLNATEIRVERLPDTSGISAVRYSRVLRKSQLPASSILGEQNYAGVRLVTLGVDPYESDGAILRVPREILVRVTWSTGSQRAADRGGRISLSRVEREIARDIPNYAEALRNTGSVDQKGMANPLPSTAASGWGIGEPALVLLVRRDGPYRLSASGFVDEGGPQSTQISVLRLRERGEFRALYVHDADQDGIFNGDDYLAFRGYRNRPDDGSYYSDITDTNAYVLTWSGGEGEVPAMVSEQERPADPITDYRATLHFEKSGTYFPGITLPDLFEGDETTVHVTEKVQNEGFYWGSINDSRRNPFTFDCSPSFGQGKEVTMDVLMAGTNYSSTTIPPQEVRAILNGYPVGTVLHADTTLALHTYTFPANVLINGTNTLSFEVVRNGDIEPAGVMIDYIELTGEWNPTADQGVERLPGAFSGGVVIDRLAPVQGEADPDAVDIAGDDSFVTIHASGNTERPIEVGHLLRVTSRVGTQLRPYPGFYLAAGEDQISSDGGTSLGITVAEVEPGSSGLRIVRYRHVPTTGSLGSMDLVADFVDEVRTGNIVVAGVAFGTVQSEKSARFISTFRSLGSSAVETESFFTSPWVFAAIKGKPESAVEEYRSGGDLGISSNLFIPDEARGRDVRGIAVIPAGESDDYVASRPMSPGIRYHDRDQLLDPANRADLIIVTHPLFASEAERLAEHRRSFSGLEVKVVDIYRIYDEFNDGIKDPVAVRRFLQYADTNWGGGTFAPSYVILFGDASWDAEQRIETSVMVDYIPSFGVPSTDQKFVVAFGDTTLSPQQFIGRLPAATLADARSMVDKLIHYDLLPPAEWNKRFVFATGGTRVDERDRLRDYALSMASIVTSDTFYGEAEVISRTGTTNAELEFPNTVDAPRVQAAMNRGGLWLDFNGHGATTTSDLNFGYPQDFDNVSRYFIFATWSCQTGLFSNRDAQLRNESFLTYPGKGSIASIGGTSFSFTSMDNSTRRLIFTKIATEPQSRSIGAIFHLSKIELYAQFFYGSPFVSYGTRARNHMMMYTLLGDPSMRIAASSTPEITVPVESVRLIGERSNEPSLGDTTLRVRGALWNFGVPLNNFQRDTMGVVYRTTLVDPQGGESIQLDTLYGLRKYDSIDVTLPVGDAPGEYVVIIEVDHGDMIAETDEEDNRTVVQFLLRGSQPLALEPLVNGIVDDPENVEIRILNPASGPGARFVIDTLPDFSSPLARSSDELGSVVDRELTTVWRLAIPENMRGAEVIWWRATSTSAEEELAERYPLEASFRIRNDQPQTQPYAVGGVYQMSRTRLQDLVNSHNGVGPGERLVPVEVTSIGQTYQGIDNSYPEIVEPKLTVRVGSVNYRVNSLDGVNLLVFPRNDVVPVIDTFFTFYTGTPLAALEDLVANRIQPGDRVIVGTNGVSLQVNEPDADARLSAIFDQLGSRLADTIESWDWWGSYALIGGKGVPDSLVMEAWIPGGERYAEGELAPFPVTVRDTIVAFPTDGRWTSGIVGPALEWRNVRLDIATGESGEATMQVLGVRRDGGRDTLRTESVTSENTGFDLHGIDPLVYPRLEFSVLFRQDTTQRLELLNVDFQPAPELAVVPSSISVDYDSVLQGNPVRFRATIENLTSFSTAGDVETYLKELGETGGVVDSLTVAAIEPLDSAQLDLVINTTKLRSGRYYALEANPDDTPAEPYSHNNRSRALEVSVSTDEIAPGLAIYADDNRLLNGDYVAPQPTFEVRMFDNSSLELDEVQAITMVVDNEWITVESGASFEVPTSGGEDLRGAFRWIPDRPLEEGAHDLRVFARDASGNGDTTEIITFYVESDLGIRNLYTWPNPMQKETTFTFSLTGALAPESGEITIFTPAGRRVRTIPLAPGMLSVGNNRVEWDGRDADGDRLANGVYFYRIVVRSGEEKVEMIDKIAVLR